MRLRLQTCAWPCGEALKYLHVQYASICRFSKASPHVYAPFRDVAPTSLHRLPSLRPILTGRKVDDWIERMLHPKQRYIEPGQLLIGAPDDERHSKSDNLPPPAE